MKSPITRAGKCIWVAYSDHSRGWVHSLAPAALMRDRALTDRLIITTDALAAAGLGPGRYPFGDMEIEIKDGKALRLDGRLAGGIGTPALALEILADLGYSRERALIAATSRPLALINAKL